MPSESQASKRCRKALQGRQVHTLICITREFTFPEMLQAVHDLGLTYGQALEMSGEVRRQISGNVVGRRIEPSQGNRLAASTGMTAVALAYLCQAREIQISGFDFDGGHFFGIPGTVYRIA